ncbi:MAG: NosD domain-containing protein [Methanobacteriota archaeon]
MDPKQKETNIFISIVLSKKAIFKPFLLITALLIVGTLGVVSGEINESSRSIPSITVVDAKGSLDISEIGNIPLGQVPDERISITTMIANNGNQVVSGLRIRTFLVREGREDTISMQLGSDFRNEDLKPGEVKTYKNNFQVSKKLKPGNYKIMIRVDPGAADNGKDTDSIQYISTQIVNIGAYAEAGGAVPIYSPNKIETPGNYLLMRDIPGGALDSMIRITTSDVTIDGGGHTIRGVPTGYTKGIYVDGGTNLKNIIIKNCKFEGVDFGLYLYRVEGATITNCEFRNCTNIGLRFDQSRSCTITSNTITDNALGLGLFQSSGNTVSNNYFKNNFNVVVNEGQRNTWDTDPHPGQNIIGGSLIAGNAWFDLNGSGFSVTTPDLNHDGIADAPYSITGENIDYYPLVSDENSGQIASTPSQSETIRTDEQGGGLEKTPESIDTNTSVETLPDTNVTAELAQSPIPEITSSTDRDNADLMIIQLEAADSVCKSDDLLINTTIQNRGNLEATSFSVDYYISDSTGVSISDTDVGSHQVGSLKSQENLTFTDTIRIPDTKGIKSYTFGAIIDPSNNVYEDNKQNNVALLNHRIQIKDC